MIQLGKLDWDQNTRKVKNLPVLVSGKDYRSTHKGKFQWRWPVAHKRDKWVTWARIVYCNDRAELIVHWNMPQAAWTEETIAIVLSCLHVANLRMKEDGKEFLK